MSRLRAFTLIEIMIVVAIMGVVLAAGVPTLYRFFNKEGFRKTVNDVTDVCTAARAHAIVKGVTAELVFHPQENRCTFGGGKSQAGGLAHSADFSECYVEMLDINLFEYKDAEIARVRFFPDGTCDEMTLILRSEKGEYRKISLEITTGLTSVEADPSKWR